MTKAITTEEYALRALDREWDKRVASGNWAIAKSGTAVRALAIAEKMYNRQRSLESRVRAADVVNKWMSRVEA